MIHSGGVPDAPRPGAVSNCGRTTTYAYDGMGRVTHMEYPDGWMEDYHYDALGQLTAIEDTDPTGKDMKQQKNVFEYDVCGNMVYEYMRGNGTGQATTEVFYTYDELHRLTSARETYGSARRDYTYDSLGNLTYESNSNNDHYDYKLNDLNQITEKYYGSKDKERTVYTYDGRGNLVKEEYGKNKKLETIAEYTYDETNRMVRGTNADGEQSLYFFNGLGALVQQTWIITKNGYGYHDVQIDDDDPTILTQEGVSDSNSKKTSTVVKQFVIDYTRETMDPLMEHEVNGLDYRYVYGLERLSVNISPITNGAGSVVEIGTVGIQIRLYYHQDLRGTVDYLTSPVSQKVESWTHYNEWGEITHNAVLKMGLRELDLVKNYTGHDYDVVLNLYYAKARMYDAENRRFLSVDPILDGTKYDLSEYVYEVVNFTAYLYVRDNPLRWVDPLGLKIADRNITLTTLQDGGGTTAGLNSAAQNTTTKAPAAQPSTPSTGASTSLKGTTLTTAVVSTEAKSSTTTSVSKTAFAVPFFPFPPVFPIPETPNYGNNPYGNSLWDNPYGSNLWNNPYGNNLGDILGKYICDALDDASRTVSNALDYVGETVSNAFDYMFKFVCDTIDGIFKTSDVDEDASSSALPEPTTAPNGSEADPTTASSYEEAKRTGKKAPKHNDYGQNGERSLPPNGEPNSSADLKPRGENQVKQRRYYGSDGRPELDIDYNHPGTGHVFPHSHPWIDGVRQ